jgi:hypothetical protein
MSEGEGMSQMSQIRPRLEVVYGPNRAPIPDDLVIVEIDGPNQSIRITVGEWLESFDPIVAGRHELVDVVVEP